MKKALTTTAALAVTALIGCVSSSSHYEPTGYEQNQSRAYNIAKAGGLVTGIRDASVPKDSLERLVDTKTFGATYILSGYSSPQFGMSDWQSGLVNLVNWSVGPKQHGARNSLLGWMPGSEATSPADAQAKMLSHVKFSVEQSLFGLGADFTLLYDKDGHLTYQFYKAEWGCPIWISGKSKISDMCSIKARIVVPRGGVAPAFVSGVSGHVYAFTSGHEIKYSRINVVNGDASHAPQQVIYRELSKNLPQWAYLYLAPNQVTLDTGDKVAFPYLLENGKPELFIYPG